MSLKESYDAWLAKSKFKPKHRIRFYEQLILLHKNGVPQIEALTEIYNIYSDEGKRPKRLRALVAQDCVLGLGIGKSLSSVLNRWVPFAEYSVIEAGEQSGLLTEAFERAITIIKAKSRISAAVGKATIYPSILFVFAGILLQKVSTELVPKLGRSTNPETWDWSARTLKVLADFVTHYGVISVGILAVLIALIFATLGTWKGGLRYYLDKVPPWSIYRMLHGSTFLLNVGVLVGSGTKLNDALTRLAENANPWLKSRVEAASYGVNIGSNLGKALYQAGYDFPDKEAISFLRVITGRTGSEEAIERFGEQWLEESVKKLESTAFFMLTIATSINGMLMLLILLGANGISDAMIQSVQR